MTPPKNAGSWRRLLMESAAVVFSILLAFAIDAWWDASKDHGREEVLLAGLLADFEATRPDLVARVSLASRLHRNTVRFRDLVADSAKRRTLQVPDTLLISAMGGPTYQPATNTLDAALASGDLELIRSDEIRSRITQWRVTLADTFESERQVRQVADERIEPMLARDIPLGPYFDRAIGWDEGEIEVLGHAAVTPSLELSGALAQRGFYQGMAAQGLADLLGTLDQLLTLIRAELEP